MMQHPVGTDHDCIILILCGNMLWLSSTETPKFMVFFALCRPPTQFHDSSNTSRNDPPIHYHMTYYTQLWLILHTPYLLYAILVMFALFHDILHWQTPNIEPKPSSKQKLGTIGAAIETGHGSSSGDPQEEELATWIPLYRNNCHLPSPKP
jgi:hypothetical protein